LDSVKFLLLRNRINDLKVSLLSHLRTTMVAVGFAS
jgi:hypothetical protein